MLTHFVGEQMRRIGRCTAQFTSYADVIDVVVVEHAADLINGAVGVGRKQDRSLWFFQRLPYHELQRHRGLAGARRPYEQKVVGGLFGAQQHLVEVGVVRLRQRQLLVAAWWALSEQQVLAVLRRGDEFVECADVGAAADIAARVLDAPGGGGEGWA